MSTRRYKGLAAGIATCSDAVLSVAERAGVAKVTCLHDSQALAASQPNPLLNAAAAAERILTTLGEPSRSTAVLSAGIH